MSTTAPVIRVLIVEDQPTSALILRGGVARAAAERLLDVRVATAHTAAAALAAIASDPPDVVLLDLVLLGSDGDGEVVLRHLRDAGAACRVIVLSGLNAEIPADAARLAALLALRPDAVLSKPTSPAAIAVHLFGAKEATP